MSLSSKIKRFLIFGALLGCFCHDGKSQIAIYVIAGPNLPATCSVAQGQIWFKTTGGAGIAGVYQCGPTDNTWTYIGSAGSPTGVTSFNSRNGAVAPVSGDYTVSQVTGAAPLTSPNFLVSATGPNPGSSDNSTEFATTNFVRRVLASSNPAIAVAAETVTILPFSPTYSSNVLTAGSNGALIIDGYTVLLNDRLLINNQSAALQNGAYTVTTLGTGSVPYVLTRSTDFNTVSKINNAGVIPVTNGTVNAGTTWALAAGITTLGTDPINYLQTNPQPAVITTVNTVPCTAGSSCTITAAPSGSATGDLSSNYPNPTVAKVNGNTPGGACTNQFVRSLNSSAVPTCATVANADLTNTATTVNSQTCTLGGSCTISTGATTNQNLRTIGAVLTPSSLTACVYVPFAGTITSFNAVSTDGATVNTVLVKVKTQATFATFVSTGVSGTTDISNGGEQLTAVLGKVDATLTSWTTIVAAATTVCFVGSTFSAGTSVNANVTVAAN